MTSCSLLMQESTPQHGTLPKGFEECSPFGKRRIWQLAQVVMLESNKFLFTQVPPKKYTISLLQTMVYFQKRQQKKISRICSVELKTCHQPKLLS